MYYILYFFLLCVYTPLSAFKLVDQLALGQQGEYIVIQHEHHLVLLHLSQRSQEVVTLEELCIPLALKAKLQCQWQAWLQQGALGHTCWNRIEIKLPQAVISVYSVDQQKELSSSNVESYILNILLTQPLKRSLSQEKKVRMYPYQHCCCLWTKPLAAEEETKCTLVAWTLDWPQDSSEFAGQTVELYLPSDQDRSKHHLTCYVPYWIHLYGRVAQVKMRVVEAGIFKPEISTQSQS